jgi:hypothetical protein
MVRALLVSIALMVDAQALPSPPTLPPSAFSLVLESTANGWAARCDTGCRWQRLSFGCERACRAVVDANGVATVATPYLDSAAFRFIVERTDHGVRATSRAGTAWQALTWKCQLDPCRARVNTYGVFGIDTAR